MTAGEFDEATEQFAQARPQLFGIAYRMLGSVAEAEDIVQDAWLRWQGADRDDVVTPTAYLTTVTTRLAINVVESARVRREAYVGPWLPEPVDTTADPAMGAERDEAVEMALLLLMERLPARERAAFVLREAFDYPYEQIADLIGVTPANARQLVARARKHLRQDRAASVTSDEHRRLLSAFLAAAQQGDTDALEAVLSPTAVSYSDGGGIAPLAARVPVQGRDRVATFIAAFSSHFWTDAESTWTQANGRPAILISRPDDSVLLSIGASPDGIEQIMWVMNPEKLGGFVHPDRRSAVTDRSAVRSTR